MVAGNSRRGHWRRFGLADRSRFIPSRIPRQQRFNKAIGEAMLQSFEDAALGQADIFLSAYDGRTSHAVSEFLASLPESARAVAKSAIDDGREAAAKSWECMQNGSTMRGSSGDVDDQDDPGSDFMRQMGSIAGGLVLDAGAEDIEHPFARTSGLPRVQRSLSRIEDSVAAQGVRNHLEQAGGGVDSARLNDCDTPRPIIAGCGG